ncbi:hypothetical protein JMN32_03855 [Fulvivirga sp. 29W222]|uniref:Uncharacterized protein n=1 Tax=Fulvivirga marina TaxID=2494733 RepID=A0A937KAG7_9BACT|nr:hypothetical protein [Fulvivirga marina]MBL6445426.1 hypothetical protein [Fulvivirga marina]
MRLQVRTILAGTMCIFLWACNGHQSHDNGLEHQEHSSQNYTAEVEKPLLDNGKKWKANEDMTVHIRAMQNDVKEFKNTEDKDYAALASQLNTNVNLVISSCTMKGKSHEELHKWLLPYKELVLELGASESAENKEKVFSSIQTALGEFDVYFE